MALNVEQRNLIERRTAELTSEIGKINTEISHVKDRLDSLERRKADLNAEIKKINQDVN